MNEFSKQTVECTFFRSAFDTRSHQAISLDQYIDQVKSGKYLSPISLLRAAYAAGDKKSGDGRKKNLPLVVAGGVMEGGRKQEFMVSYSQCITVDIDKVAGSATDILRRAGELPYVKAGHISASGRGVKLFVLVDSGLPQHLLAFETVRCRIETDLPGVEVDISGKDPNRSCFVSADPSAF